MHVHQYTQYSICVVLVNYNCANSHVCTNISMHCLNLKKIISKVPLFNKILNVRAPKDAFIMCLYFYINIMLINIPVTHIINYGFILIKENMRWKSKLNFKYIFTLILKNI